MSHPHPDLERLSDVVPEGFGLAADALTSAQQYAHDAAAGAEDYALHAATSLFIMKLDRAKEAVVVAAERLNHARGMPDRPPLFVTLRTLLEWKEQGVRLYAPTAENIAAARDCIDYALDVASEVCDPDRPDLVEGAVLSLELAWHEASKFLRYLTGEEEAEP